MVNFLRRSAVSSSFIVLSFSFAVLLSGCGDLDTEIESLTISPSRATVGVDQYQLFTVTGKDELGMIVDVDPSWSVSGGIGDITSAGLFTAGSASGEGTVVATYKELSVSAAVTVTDLGWIAGRVYDSKGSLVPNLKVYLKGTDLLDFTDTNGDYSISDVPAGTYEVWTQETSVYRAASDEVTVESGETSTADFTVLYFTDPPDLTPPEFTL